MKNHPNPTLILDTSAFIARLPFQLTLKMVTTPEVISEIKKGSLVESVATLIEMERIFVQSATSPSKDEVLAKAKLTKDDFVLSSADLSILALALELQKQEESIEIVTDDYSLQNTAKEMNIPYRIIRTKGIKDRWTWKIICPGCHREFTEDFRKGDECPICGTKLTRYRPKPKRGKR
ncbi:MAG: NOB1 family endonuclease [Candidatus Ranarchaeia archaeon]